MSEFSDKVFAVVSRVPEGRVTTYGQVARAIGSPRAARYVGFALHNNPRPGRGPHCIPCHRVVFKDGSLAPGFAFGGPGAQRRMLEEEGVPFDDEGRVLLEACQWSGGRNDGGDPLGPPPDFDWKRELGDL